MLQLHRSYSSLITMATVSYLRRHFVVARYSSILRNISFLCFRNDSFLISFRKYLHTETHTHIAWWQRGTEKIITTVFIQHLYRSSYRTISAFRNSVNFAITDITNAIKITPIVSWNFDLVSRVIIRSISRPGFDRQHFSMICPSNYQENILKHNAAIRQCS